MDGEGAGRKQGARARNRTPHYDQLHPLIFPNRNRQPTGCLFFCKKEAPQKRSFFY
jgi:hypothetical protein